MAASNFSFTAFFFLISGSLHCYLVLKRAINRQGKREGKRKKCDRLELERSRNEKNTEVERRFLTS